jgi:hypothetical protein
MTTDGSNVLEQDLLQGPVGLTRQPEALTSVYRTTDTDLAVAIDRMAYSMVTLAAAIMIFSRDVMHVLIIDSWALVAIIGTNRASRKAENHNYQLVQPWVAMLDSG